MLPILPFPSSFDLFGSRVQLALSLLPAIPSLAVAAPRGPRWLETTSFLGNPAWIWLWSLGLSLVLWALFFAVRQIVVVRGAKLAERTATDLDDGLVLLAARTNPILLLFPAFHLGCRGLELPARVEHGLTAVTGLALLLQVGLWGFLAIDFWIRRTRKVHHYRLGTEALIGTLGFIGKVVFVSVLLLLGLNEVGVNITALVAGLGIGGVAVALALQNVLGDLLAAIAIVIDRPFEVGDSITVDTFSGTVESVGLKTTRVRSVHGEQIVFANSDLLKSRIRNFRRLTERRVRLGLSVSCATPVDRLEQVAPLIREAIEGQEDVRFDRAHFAALGASSYDFEAIYFILSPDYALYMDRQQAILLAVLRRLEEIGVEAALPESRMQVQRRRPPGD